MWLSPPLLKRQAETIASALAEARPDLAPAIGERLAALTNELDSLHAELSTRLAPLKGRTIMVFHPSWGYFTDAYGLRQLAIEHEGQPPSDAEITRLRQVARECDVRLVAVEPQIDSRAARAIARSLGARVVSFDPIAADVPANLRHVADVLLESMQPTPAQPTSQPEIHAPTSGQPERKS